MKTKGYSFSQIHKIAIPALIAGVAEPLLSITDSAIIGNSPYKPVESLAAVGIVGTFISMLIWVFGQARSALSAIISQYYGANELHKIKQLPAQSIAFIVGLSLLVLLISYPFASAIFSFYNATNEVLLFCVSYFKIRIIGLPFALYTFAVFGVFRGLQNTLYPMVVAISGAVLNIVLDLLLVYGYGILPAMGVEGAALASVIAQVFMALFSTYYLYKKTSFKLQFSLPLHPELKRFTAMVLNLFVRTLALNLALYLGTSYATAYGKNYIAAYTIGVNLWFLGAFIADGYGSAGNIISGKLWGEKNTVQLKQLNKQLMCYSLFLGITMLSLGLLFYTQIGLFFTTDQAVLEHFYSTFWIILLMQPIAACTFLLDGTFKGMGQMAFLRNVLLIATFVGFVPTLLFFDYFNFKLHAIWAAFVVWLLFRGGILFFRFKRLI